MKESSRSVAKEYLALCEELDKAGLENFYYPSELWFFPDGNKRLRQKATLPTRVDDATKEEIKFAEIVLKHFPDIEK